MNSKIFLALALVTFLIFPSPGFSKEVIRSLEGIVTKVSDGDTIQVHSGGTKLKIRLYGIDSPETEKINRRTGRVSKPGQPYGGEAEDALNGKIGGKSVRIDVVDIDKYKRLVSIVWLGSRNINKEMVAQGYAWAYKKYLSTPYASEFIKTEEHARSKRIGLWEHYNPTAPWQFRKLQREIMHKQ
ncbi:MAG: thermonuclease family protein [Geobacteraceae bacterium]